MTDARARFDAVSNQGRWGPDDSRGTLNLITADAVARGAAAVRHGRVVSLARGLYPGRRLSPPAFVSHRMLYQQHEPSGALDSVEIAPHGFEVTHVDALSHVYFEGGTYNGRRAADVVTPDGLTFGDIAPLASGIVTRGLLLDVAEARSVHHLRPTDVVTAADLDLAVSRTGIEVAPGDAVVVRTGIEHQPDEDRLSTSQRTGIDTSAVEWLREHDVGVYVGDCIEALPGTGDFDMPLHMLGLSAIGLILVDAPLVEPLVDASRELSKRDFMFVCAPLPIHGATGSAVNPLAIL